MKTPIAIVGIGCRFPGASNSPDELWRLLTHAVDGVREVPPDRWHSRSYYHPDPALAAAARGRMLFYRTDDTRISGDGIACSS